MLIHFSPLALIRICLPLSFLLLPRLLDGADCQPLPASKEAALVAYIETTLNVLPNTLHIAADTVQAGCYRKLAIEGSVLTTPLTLFLSPDQRFLSSSLLDTSIDPTVARDTNARRVSALLSRDISPSRGAISAPLTLVEFSDFACPFCRRFNDWLAALPPDLLSRTRIVYKNLPLPIHPWAREAAQTAACLDHRDPGVFWQFADFFFREQETLNTANFRQRVSNYGSTVPGVTAIDIEGCIANPGPAADATLQRDLDLARALNIRGTPAVFINGAPVLGVQSATDLRTALERALSDKPPRTSADTGS